MVSGRQYQEQSKPDVSLMKLSLLILKKEKNVKLNRNGKIKLKKSFSSLLSIEDLIHIGNKGSNSTSVIASYFTIESL